MPVRAWVFFVALLCVLSSSLALSVAGADEPGGPPRPTPVATSVASAEPLAPEPPSNVQAPSGVVTLNAVGDVALARNMTVLMERYGADYPYDGVRDLLGNADLTIANFEGTLTNGGVRQSKMYTFRTPPHFAPGLVNAGIDLVSLGNNHAMDFGNQGLFDTMAALDAAGVPFTGAGVDEGWARTPVVLEINGLRIAFLSYCAITETIFATPTSPGVARATVASLQSDVPNARAQADVVIVALHAGTQYVDQPNSQQVQLSRAAIDAGAHLVLGHHAHTLQGWTEYNGGTIVYGLGNFVFDLDEEDLYYLGPRAYETAILHMTLTRDGVSGVEAWPVVLDYAEERPWPPSPEQGHAILNRLARINATLP